MGSVSDVVKVDEVNIFASPMPRDFEQIGNTGEAAFAREARRDLLDRDRCDGVDFDLASFELISPPGANFVVQSPTDTSHNAIRMPCL